MYNKKTRTTSIINLTSLPSLLLGVTHVLANRRKNTLTENKYMEPSQNEHIEPSQNEQYYNSGLVISGRKEEQARNRPR